MGLILQSQLERALVKTKDYIDKKTEETPEICYLSDYGIPSYYSLRYFSGKNFYLNDTSKIPKLVNTVINNPNKIYVLPYSETGQGYISSLKVSSPAPNAALFAFFVDDDGVETEYLITVTSGYPYITVSKQPYQKILKSGINIKTINGYSILGEGDIEIAAIQPMISVTWDELKEIQDNGELKSGQQYKITDYVTTTSQAETKSAGHPFDVIVTADSENTLNEEARACLHEGDTYFSNAGAKLEAWKIWYSLDNDTDRFAWACNNKLLYTINSVNTYIFEEPVSSVVFKDYKYHLKLGIPKLISSGPPVEVTLVDEYTIKVDSISNGADSYINGMGGIKVYSEGKGVIYRMVDEFNNDCPYDFKNIQFKHPNDTTTYPDYYYTFSWIDDNYNVMDTSIFGNNGTLTFYGEIKGVCGNIIKSYIEDSGESLGTKQLLNNITFISDCEYEYSGNEGFYGCNFNTFGNNCYSNSFGNDCYSNSFGNNCYSNSFGTGCDNNTFGNECYSNTFVFNCYSNSFGNNCENNSFGNDCCNNTFGHCCWSNRFGQYCWYNIFGQYVMRNTLGSDCDNNIFGQRCSDNTLGNDCCNNTFGQYCIENSFRLSASKTETLKNYCQYNYFDDGCSYNVIWNSSTTGSSNKLQNINVSRGVSGTSSNYNFINIDTLNTDYETQVAKNSKGEIKIYCEADLIA